MKGIDPKGGVDACLVTSKDLSAGVVELQWGHASHCCWRIDVKPLSKNETSIEGDDNIIARPSNSVAGELAWLKRAGTGAKGTTALCKGCWAKSNGKAQQHRAKPAVPSTKVS